VWSIDWIDRQGVTVETLVGHGDVFDSPSDVLQILMAQKLKKRIDETLSLFQD
jgi:hypothetical protein